MVSPSPVVMSGVSGCDLVSVHGWSGMLIIQSGDLPTWRDDTVSTILPSFGGSGYLVYNPHIIPLSTLTGLELGY